MKDNNQVQIDQIADRTAVEGRKIEFDYLRVFVVVIVLFVHAALAYTTFAFINSENPIENSNPIVNQQRWIGFDLMIAINETFVMPMLFLVSGLFVWKSILKRGVRKFFVERLKRLGVPFIIGVFLLIPLVYYPALLQAKMINGSDSSFGSFWFSLLRSGFGTAGHLWFLWLLLAFNAFVTFFYKVLSHWVDCIQIRLNMLLDHPVLFLSIIFGMSALVYVPVALLFGPLTWIGVGPFHVQIGRILLYLLYFVTGTIIGAIGFNNNLFRYNGFLVKHWWKLMILAFISCITFITMIIAVTKMERTIITETAFVISCGSTLFGLIGFFLRFMNRRIRILDNLSKNSYGIYIVHYGFVTWLQYFLLGFDLTPLSKGLVVFAGTLILSWITSAIIRRIPVIAKVI